ncbi:MAG: sigma-54-dependent Fis family transcriptional regulator [Blastocatellia bacterium]|jgi:DNA-binding NtrC family response regulator|nr:sigma-54-dependent Fis family transcriptional regulator [Blastocatellia bacterium]MBK6425076.1 sigma-54-dependent Fis family transcriptional regulator [Blastocatellia bacterium]
MSALNSASFAEARTKVLVVDDEQFLRSGLSEYLRHAGYSVAEAASMTEARGVFTSFQPDVVFVDYVLPEGTALELLPEFTAAGPLTSVIVMTGHATIDLAVSAIKLGAEQFLTKPFEFDSVRVLLDRTLENQRNRQQVAADLSAKRTSALDPFLGVSRAIRTLADEAGKVARAETPVLILGETGSGKGVLARWMHENSPRAREPFVDTNCAGFAPELLDTELFGHERGAFTGAVTTKPGLVEVAHRGVLFLDEIGDMSLQTQPKLLKILEEQRFRRVGATRERPVDVRMVAATNRDLQAAVAAGQFRSDLYYRISMVPLTVPALRDRPEDILPLSRSILDRLAPRYHRREIGLTTRAEAALASYPWPGNVRELRNVLERAVLLAASATLGESDLRLPRSASAESAGAAPKWTLEAAERHHIERVLEANGSNVTRTARVLGVSRSALYAKLQKHAFNLPLVRPETGTAESVAAQAPGGGEARSTLRLA